MAETAQIEIFDLPALPAATIRAAFTGPAVDDGRMDVRNFAPALLAIDTLLQESQRVLNGTDHGLRVLLRAELKPGSFEFVVDVIWAVPGAIVAALASNPASALTNLLDIVGFVRGPVKDSLISVLKQIGGRRIMSTKPELSGDVRVSVEGEDFVMRRSVASLLADRGVRNAFYQAMKPVESPGITSLEIREAEPRRLSAGEPPEDVVVETVTKEDMPAFAPLAPEPAEADTDIPPTTRQMVLTVVAPNFEGSKWKFFDGNSPMTASVTDPIFLLNVENRVESFSKDDLITADVTIRQSVGPKGIKSEFEISRVISHAHLPRQMNLPAI